MVRIILNGVVLANVEDHVFLAPEGGVLDAIRHQNLVFVQISKVVDEFGFCNILYPHFNSRFFLKMRFNLMDSAKALGVLVAAAILTYGFVDAEADYVAGK